MAETDSPLKRLVSTFILDFAAWLLQADVRAARPLNVELPGETRSVDLVFHITLADGRTLVLHIEFQGRRSHHPVPWRMLDYMTDLAQTHRLDLWSVVFYVGRGAGAEDTGQYAVNGLDGTPTLTWRYQPIRLWQMSATELLAIGSPALLAFIGQTRIETPEVVLPEVVTRIRSVADRELRGRLFSALTTLIHEEEMVAMVEKLIEREELLLDTPYLRRIRNEGREEGQAQGRTTGALMARRRSILETLAWRFDPPISVYQLVEQHLETLTDEPHLARLLAVAIRADSMAAFQAALIQENHTNGSG